MTAEINVILNDSLGLRSQLRINGIIIIYDGRLEIADL